MDKDAASRIMEHIAGMNVAMNNVASEIENVPGEDEKRLLRRGIGNLIGLAYTDLMLPIIRQYPELDPDC